ncbi:hypothetical protein GALL_514970 [mine drainage metagenome]|uniref:Uncharacterized protein n=1 Tax=mine drainage metagenome TaxID=410659 RepID=A0A1J5P5W9_9ZZZZ
MRAGIEKFAEMPSRIRNRLRIGHADAVEAERARLVGEFLLEIGGRKSGRRVQKSRST